MKSRGKSGQPRRRWTIAAGSVALVALAAAATGCDQREVQHFRVAKQAQPPAAPATPAAMGGGAPPGMQGDVPPPPAVQGGGLAWTLPSGWKESRTGGMRYATLTPPVPGKVDVSVTVLSGAAGGELANVNRWRDQIGLPPLAGDAGLAAARTGAKAPAGTLAVYDFTSEDGARRVVAALAEKDGSTWFVKLAGDAQPVAAARNDFMKLLGSLRFDDRP